MIYFDNAATTFPKPPSVPEEVLRCMQEYGGNPGRSGHRLSLRAAETVYACRAELAELFGCPSAENVVFTYNTTYALNMAIHAMVEPGTHVLISNLEHNSVLRPIDALARQGICSYSVFDATGSAEKTLASLERAYQRDTTLIVCTHVSNITGKVLPVGRIGAFAKRRGIRFILDAAQSAGVYPIHMEKMRVDALCIPGHKGLYGPQGSGAVLFCEEGSYREFIRGGNGINSKERSMPDFLPERYEAGTLGTPAIAGLLAGVRFVRERGVDALRAHEVALCRRMENALSRLRTVRFFHEKNAALVLFSIDGVSSEEVARYLDGAGFCVRGGLHCSPLGHEAIGTPDGGAVRVSPGAFNTAEECDLFCDAVSAMLHERGAER